MINEQMDKYRHMHDIIFKLAWTNITPKYKLLFLSTQDMLNEPRINPTLNHRPCCNGMMNVSLLQAGGIVDAIGNHNQPTSLKATTLPR